MLKFKQKPKTKPLNDIELLYYRLEEILKQMLIVWAKESVAVRTISGTKSGTLRRKKKKNNKK